MSVRRMRDRESGLSPAERRRRAILRFALWEAAGFVPLALGLVWIHALGPERPAGEAATITIIAIALFAVYVGVLFVRILAPALREIANAR